MKYSEAKKAIEALSSKYNIYMTNGNFVISYKGHIKGIYVSGTNQYKLNVIDSKSIVGLPFSNKLYMILSELAMTPLDEWVEEKKYKVKAFRKYLNVPVQNVLSPFLFDGNNTETVKTYFTSNEIEQLKQRDDIPLDWNKVKLEEAND